MTNSRDKGARRERMIAADLSAVLGVRAERMGRNGKTAEDIDHDIPGVHVESKGPARFSAWKYMDQAIRDAGDKVPLVLVRADRRETLAVVRLADLPELSNRVVLTIEPESPEGRESE